MIEQPIFMALALGSLWLVLSACEGPNTVTQPQMRFLGAQTRLIANDMVDVTVSAARPRQGAMKAYADCVGSQYAIIRGMDYARKVTSLRSGNGDVLTDKVTYLISEIPPSGEFVLNAKDVVAKCNRAGVPTV